MTEKSIPEYMKAYMENIGHECFTDYSRLSREYHDTIQTYHEMKFPRRIPIGSRFTPQKCVQTDLYRIEEQFKARALDIACEKYDYKDPGYESYDRDFTEIQESNYNNAGRDQFDRTAEDIRAAKAHAAFEKAYPDKVAEKQANREVIDLYYSGPDHSRQTVKEEPVKEPEQKKESLSREELFQTYTASRDEMLEPKHKASMSGRFFMTLSSERETPEVPDPGARDMSMEKDHIEIEPEI